jgi:hypothetical protein
MFSLCSIRVRKLLLESRFYTPVTLTRPLIAYCCLHTPGNIFAVSCAGLIAAATFATLDEKHGMHGWQW